MSARKSSMSWYEIQCGEDDDTLWDLIGMEAPAGLGEDTNTLTPIKATPVTMNLDEDTMTASPSKKQRLEAEKNNLLDKFEALGSGGDLCDQDDKNNQNEVKEASVEKDNHTGGGSCSHGGGGDLDEDKRPEGGKKRRLQDRSSPTIDKSQGRRSRHRHGSSRMMSEASSSPMRLKKPRTNIPFWQLAHREEETDQELLQRRQKDIDFGKNTIGYQVYTETVTKGQRKHTDPWTPKKYFKCPRRSWDQQIKNWRRQLHDYDPPGVAMSESDVSEFLSDMMSGSDFSSILTSDFSEN